jgi:hypothetical protein
MTSSSRRRRMINAGVAVNVSRQPGQRTVSPWREAGNCKWRRHDGQSMVITPDAFLRHRERRATSPLHFRHLPLPHTPGNSLKSQRYCEAEFPGPPDSVTLKRGYEVRPVHAM